MTPSHFKKLMCQCRTAGELENLLTRWHEITGTWDELVAVREAWVARSLILAEGCGRSECAAPELQPE